MHLEHRIVVGRRHPIGTRRYRLEVPTTTGSSTAASRNARRRSGRPGRAVGGLRELQGAQVSQQLSDGPAHRRSSLASQFSKVAAISSSPTTPRSRAVARLRGGGANRGRRMGVGRHLRRADMAGAPNPRTSRERRRRSLDERTQDGPKEPPGRRAGRSLRREKPRVSGAFVRWAVLGSNQ